MTESLLLVARGKSKLTEIIPDRFKVQVLALESTDQFSAVSPDTALIIFDLENERRIPEQLLGIRSFSLLQDIPIWGFLERKDLKAMNLFYSFGGSRLLNGKDLGLELESLSLLENKHQSTDIDAVAPAMNPAAKDIRLTEQLDFILIQQWLAELKKNNLSYHSAMKGILERIVKLVKPHLAIILINSNQQAEAFVTPGKMIFKQDYHDFMNFCLNDFFVHFQSLNLENIEETFFIEDRTDFDKINMNQHKISSYIYFPIKNQHGEIEATLHLGHLMNNYFSNKLINTVNRFLESMSGSFFYTLREHQIRLRKQKILNIFGRFVPPEIIPDLISREHSKDTDKVEKREIVVLFSDIRSFTSITEQNGAQQVVDFLNRHFDIMVSIIKKHGGTIDKFIGDAIVAIFGASETVNSNALRAARAAVGMIEALPTVDCSRLILKDGSYGIGIGIHEGPAIIGNVGSPEKADYTAIGNVIGIAEELEALTKNYTTQILISEKAQKSIGSGIKMNLEDTISLGKEDAMKIYSPDSGGNNGR